MWVNVGLCVINKSICTKCASIKKSLLIPDTKINVYNTHKTLDFGHREKGNTKWLFVSEISTYQKTTHQTWKQLSIKKVSLNEVFTSTTLQAYKQCAVLFFHCSACNAVYEIYTIQKCLESITMQEKYICVFFS